jgi:hypothetical protein
LFSGLKELLASDNNPTRLKEAWKKLVEELNFLDEEVNFCFMRRILGKQMITEDKFDALAARKSFPAAGSSNDYVGSPGGFKLPILLRLHRSLSLRVKDTLVRFLNLFL